MIRYWIFTTWIFLLSFQIQAQLIKNLDRLADMEKKLSMQQSLLSKAKIPVLDFLYQSLESDEMLAMKYLYAYMPLGDLGEYSSEFFLSNVRQSLVAIEEMPWGRTIPEEIFLQFVLPLRVNNEPLDSFRLIMYHEIKSRIAGLDMQSAALEINHWCHEKVSYRGTDTRTSSPLATLSKTFGRCGEESTFTIAAMRTAGIPARQVYTPRWAHTDDNHAWVEVWIHGKWYYMGACEPEPELNMGWFTGPASRAILMHTRTYGPSFGNEEVILHNDLFSELNLSSHYTTVKPITIRVIQPDGRAATHARIEIQLYNYGELYPLTSVKTNEMGYAQFKIGLGDVFLWATHKEWLAWKKISVSMEDTVLLTLEPAGFSEKTITFDQVPPHGTSSSLEVSPEARAYNNLRIRKEDSIRNITMKSFPDSNWVKYFAKRNQMNAFDLIPYFLKSYGNWKQLSHYIEKNHPKNNPYLIPLLQVVSDKDLSDVPEAIFTDHLLCASEKKYFDPGIPKDIFLHYVLSPRIQNEPITAWRSLFQQEFSIEIKQKPEEIPNEIIHWIQQEISLPENADGHSRVTLSPQSVWKLRVANAVSRDIFFVAACRSFGIPARLNPETQEPEFWHQHQWYKAGISGISEKASAKGYLKLLDKGSSENIKYNTHFTLGLFRQGSFHTLKFEEGKELKNFPDSISLDEGQYRLVTGTRLDNGTVLLRMDHFNIVAGKLYELPVLLRNNANPPVVIGKIDPKSILITNPTTGKQQSLQKLSHHKASIILILDPAKEPSRHVLAEIQPYLTKIDRWEGNFFILFSPGNDATHLPPEYTLPKKATSGINKDMSLIHQLEKIGNIQLKNQLPVIIFCDARGKIFYLSKGYQIGSGETILRMMHQ